VSSGVALSAASPGVLFDMLFADDGFLRAAGVDSLLLDAPLLDVLSFPAVED